MECIGSLVYDNLGCSRQESIVDSRYNVTGYRECYLTPRLAFKNNKVVYLAETYCRP